MLKDAQGEIILEYKLQRREILAGMSILLVEQNARLVFKLSQMAYILEVGKIILEGSSENLVNNELVKKTYMGTKV
jgi:branched-chain amino acid transport system ATP-binding protein